MTDRDRPTIQMRPQDARAASDIANSTTLPEWIRQAKANADQIIEACDVAQATYNLAVANLNSLLSQRADRINQLGRVAHGSPRTQIEEQILAIQLRIVEARHELDDTLRDLEALRQEKMRVIR